MQKGLCELAPAAYRTGEHAPISPIINGLKVFSKLSERRVKKLTLKIDLQISAKKNFLGCVSYPPTPTPRGDTQPRKFVSQSLYRASGSWCYIFDLDLGY